MFFPFQEALLLTFIPLRWNLSARISLRGLRSLICFDILRGVHNVGFLTELLMSWKTLALFRILFPRVGCFVCSSLKWTGRQDCLSLQYSELPSCTLCYAVVYIYTRTAARWFVNCEAIVYLQSFPVYVSNVLKSVIKQIRITQCRLNIYYHIDVWLCINILCSRIHTLFQPFLSYKKERRVAVPLRNIKALGNGIIAWSEYKNYRD